MNVLAISGNITRDPEGKEIGNDNFVCKISVAMNKKIKENEHTTYLEVEIWGAFGRLIHTRYRKGDAITLSGELRQDTWEDKDTGAKRSKHYMIANQKGAHWPNHDDGNAKPQTEQTTTNANPTESQPGLMDGKASAGGVDPIDDIPFAPCL